MFASPPQPQQEIMIFAHCFPPITNSLIASANQCHTVISSWNYIMTAPLARTTVMTEYAKNHGTENLPHNNKMLSVKKNLISINKPSIE